MCYRDAYGCTRGYLSSGNSLDDGSTPWDPVPNPWGEDEEEDENAISNPWEDEEGDENE